MWNLLISCSKTMTDQLPDHIHTMRYQLNYFSTTFNGDEGTIHCPECSRQFSLEIKKDGWFWSLVRILKNSTAYYGTIKTGLNLMLEETEESWPNIYGYKMPDGNIFYYHNVFFKTKDEIPRIMSENDRIGKYARPLAQEFDLIKQCSEHVKFISDEKKCPVCNKESYPL